MALGISRKPGINSYPIGEKIELLATGVTGPILWTYTGAYTRESGSDTSSSIALKFNQEATGQKITVASTLTGVPDSVTISLNGTKCNGGCPYTGSGGSGTSGSTTCDCTCTDPGSDSDCKTESSAATSGANTGAGIGNGNSISIGSDLTLRLSGPAASLPLLGGALDLRFYRQNGLNANKASIPVGIGGGLGGRLALDRHIYFAFSTDPTIPLSSIVTMASGDQASYQYFAYDAGGNELWRSNINNDAYLTHFLNRDQWLEADHNRTYFEYDSKGYLFRQTLLSGAQAYFWYDSSYRIARITGDTPTPAYFAYNAAGNLDRVFLQPVSSGDTPRTWYYEYQDIGVLGKALSRIRNPADCFAYFGYDSNGNVVKEIDTQGATNYYQYDASSNLIQMILPDSPATTYSQTSSSMTKLTQAPTLATYYSLDTAYSRFNQVQLDQESTPEQAGYDVNGDRVKALDRLGRATYFAYDSVHNQIRAQDPFLNTSYYLYNVANNRLLQTQDKLGRVTYYGYDNNGNQVQILDALNQSTYYAYNTGGVQIKSLDTRGFSSYFGYDAYGRQMQTQDALNNSTYFAYDSYGNQTRSVSARWREGGALSLWTSYYTYDVLNRRTQSVDDVGGINVIDYGTRCDNNPVKTAKLVSGLWQPTYYIYDGLNRQTVVTDAYSNSITTGYLGRITQKSQQLDKRNNASYWGYDSRSRLNQTLDALSNSTYFQYDAVDYQTASVSARWKESSPVNFVTYYGFDALNRQVQVRDALSFTTYFGYDVMSNRTKVLNKRNFATYYTYDALNRQCAVQDVLSNVTYFGFDSNSNQTRVRDPRGNTTYYSYDALNRQSAVQDALLNVTYFGFDANGNQIKVQDARNFTTYFGFDRDDRQAVMQDTLLNNTYYGYDENSNRTQMLNARGFSIYFGYDLLNRQVKSRDALNGTTYFGYDQNSNQTIQVDQRGSAAYFGFDTLNRQSQMLDALKGSTYFGYDANGNQVKTLNPRGYASYFGYDTLDRQSKTQDALNGTVYFEYDGSGNQIKTLNKRSFASYFGYDALNRQSLTLDALNGSTYFGYDANGKRVAFLPQRGAAIYYGYDALNRQTQSVDGVGDITYLGYDGNNNRTKILSPRIFATYFGYDALSRNSQWLDAVNGTGYFGYDGVGNTVKTLDALARATYFDFDGLNRTTVVLDANRNAVYFGYDAVGNRVADVDALLHTTYYRYDALNRLAAQLDPLNQVAYYGYDANGNLIQSLDNKGNVTYYSYDALDRRVGIQFGLGYGLDQYGYGAYGDPVQSFAYDAESNMVAMLDSWGSTYFGYDALNRVAQRITPRLDAVYYGYDAASNLTKLLYPQGTSTCYYGYDAANRLNQQVSPANKSTYYVYDASSNVTKKTLGNGVISWASFDGAERVASIRYTKSDGTGLVYFEYGRDVSGRINVINREATAGFAIYYSYDNIDRLLAETWRKQSDNTQVYAFSYSYDAANNRLQMRRESTAGTETESAYYSYAADNSLTKRKVTTPSTIVDTYYYYDANGSMSAVVEGGSPTYFTYNANQLIQSLEPSGETPSIFSYDAQLNRYAQSIKGTLTYFLWDGLNPLEERDASGNLQARYTNGYTRLPGIGSVVEVQRTAGPLNTTYYQYPLMDHRGTVYAITAANQDIQSAYTPDAFGRPLANPSGNDPNVPNLLQNQTNWLSQVIGGNTYSISPSRVYSPHLGIFLSQDVYPKNVNILLSTPGDGLGIYTNTTLGGPILRGSLRQGTVLGYTNRVLDAGQRILRYYKSNTDMFGNVDGFNLYSLMLITEVMDSTGLKWEQYKGGLFRGGESLFQASEDGDTLMQLASKLTGNAADWVCLWPQENICGFTSLSEWKDKTKYPVASKNDIVAVDNVLDNPNAPSLKIRTSIDLGSRWLFGDFLYQTNVNNVANAVKNLSQEGSSPIGLFEAHGHLSNAGLPLFPQAVIALSGPNNKNTYENARRRKGPHRCWFTRNAQINVYSCSGSAGGIGWAAALLRAGGGAQGGGPKFSLEIATGAFGLAMSMYQNNSGSIVNNYWTRDGLRTDPQWLTGKGAL